MCVSNSFGSRAGFEVNNSHIFPQHVQAAITLLGRGAGDVVARTGAVYGPVLLLCSVVMSVLLWVRSGPMVLEQMPCVLGANWLNSL